MTEHPSGADEPILRVEDLRTQITVRAGVVKAVDGVSFTIRRGETVGLVGESGSGKTMTLLSIMGLMPVAAARIVGGRIWFDGRDLLREPESAMRRVRGARIAMIMQDALTALNPVLTIGDQVTEPLRYHPGRHSGTVRERAIEVLESVRIPGPERRLGEYPHQFSGGMRQRVLAAMALGPSPDLILADEPTTALDVTIQAQFLTLMRRIQRESGASALWVTHDLGVVAQTCDRVNVMYAGRIVESGEVRRILHRPRHPYTVALMDSVPKLGRRTERLYQIQGQPPDLLRLPPGCAFYDRCPLRMDVCREVFPPATPIGDGFVHCWAVGDGTSSVPDAPEAAAAGGPAA
ncbi:MAG TPA: ABC transporter ATP-binding protein [Candidatus Limnocylindrales bacterium]|nr:ABC transporter ATP-binding protein [Candidatus Limnocylindrales bacterium]